MTHDDVLNHHNTHLASIDRFLPPADPLSTQPAFLGAPEGRELSVEVAGSRGVAVATVSRSAIGDDAALWMPLTSHALDVRLAGADRGAALSALLDEWLSDIVPATAAGDWETAATITVASRDHDLTVPLLAHGFAPTGIVGIRTRGSGMAAANVGEGIHIRVAHESDLDRIADLDELLLTHDARSGSVNLREGARDTLRAGIAERFALAPEWTWVLERDGRVIGFLHMLPPGKTGWFANQSSFGGDAGFLVSIFVDPAERSAGAGALLVRTAHDALDALGAPAMTLDYAVTNPLSPSFWARMGYRPLWTSWRRRPVRFVH